MKKLLALILTMICVVSLMGCGKTETLENPYRLKTQILERYHNGETQTTRTEYIYDENGWLIETQTFDGEEWWYTTRFIRDEKGNSQGSETSYADGTQMKEVALTLDKQGRMLTSESYLNGKLEKTTEYGYNDDGQITKRYTTTIDTLGGEDRVSCIDSTFDQQGNLVREDVRWEPGNETGYNLYLYENGKLIREESYSGEKLDVYKEYTFDDTGLVQTALTKKGETFIQSKHVTTFDEYGNPLEVLAFAYGSEFARLGKTEEEPDSRTTNIYEEAKP
ncbi:MAG: hypothetical protein J6J12_05395 [Oscillospiraceae bacterium]|nr:hypothetical protein [Oscillospiraceae bacterium]